MEKCVYEIGMLNELSFKCDHLSTTYRELNMNETQNDSPHRIPATPSPPSTNKKSTTKANSTTATPSPPPSQKCQYLQPSTDSLELININKYRVVAIIPAAGTSERFISNNSKPSNNKSVHMNVSNNSAIKHNKQPKQYQNICGRALIYHTVCAFLRIKWIDFIVVVAPEDSLKQMEQILSPLVTRQQKRFVCIPGATTRHSSIKLGIDYISKQESTTDIVVVHDGARPFVDQETLHRLVSIADLYGAAGTVCKLTSTIVQLDKQANNDNCDNDLFKINRALDRSKYWASEMPQAFKFAPLLEAYQKCSGHDYEHNTECLDLLQRYTGTEARLVQVDPNCYFKVTYRKDLYTADNILKEYRNILLHFDFHDQSMSINYKFIKDLKDILCARFSAVNYFNNSTVNDRYQSNAANHSTGFVHVRLHYCHEWMDVVEEDNDSNLMNYEHLIYLVIISPNTKKIVDADQTSANGEFDDTAYPKLTQWARAKVTKKDVKNFYLILVHCNNLELQSERIRNTIVYLSRELPTELSGQTFFM